jgi:hypothetical protein
MFNDDISVLLLLRYIASNFISNGLFPQLAFCGRIMRENLRNSVLEIGRETTIGKNLTFLICVIVHIGFQKLTHTAFNISRGCICKF